MERKKNEEIKGWISSSSLILVYMIHLPTIHVCTNFQTSRPHSSRENCDEKFQCWKLERKKNEEIKGWTSSSSLIPVYMIHLPLSTCVPSFNLLGLTVPEKSVTKKFNVENLRERKIEEIKGWIRAAAWLQYIWYICPLPICIPSFNLLGLTVSEKSVTKNSNVWKINWTWRLSILNLIRQQGHVTPKWLIWSSRNLNSSEILCLSWLPAGLTKIRSKMNEQACKSMGNFSDPQGQLTP